MLAASNFIKKKIFRDEQQSSFFRNSFLSFYFQDKFAIIEEICYRLHENLTKYSSYDKEGSFEPPTALLWLYYYLGQHYDFKKEFDKAIDIVEKAIEHTPTLIELFVLKGKIYKVRQFASLDLNKLAKKSRRCLVVYKILSDINFSWANTKIASNLKMASFWSFHLAVTKKNSFEISLKFF